MYDSTKIMRELIMFIMIPLSSLLAKDDLLPLTAHPVTDVYPGWKLGIQLWTFHQYTFLEAIEKAASTGVSWVEAYPGQKLGNDYPDQNFDHNLPAELREKVKQKLAEYGLYLSAYGVVDLPNDEAKCRQVFDFARDMGINVIAAEPPEEAMDLVDQLCNEYKISVAIHNHPEPSHYWNPDRVVAAIKGHSNYLGSCADLGHWPRSGVGPLEGLKKLAGHIVSLHFKDLNEFGNKDAHDVPWGTGILDMPAVLNELQRQKFAGPISIEYEYNWDSSLPEIRQCITAFNAAVAKLHKPAWKNLFSADLSAAIFKAGSWELKDGILGATGGDDIWTREKYGDFILDLEFKLDPQTNSGVFLRTGDIVNWLHTAIEVQILDSYGKTVPDRQDCGAIFDCLAPAKNMVKKAGEWNRYTITCKANKIYVVLNGQQIIDMDLNLWKEAHKNPDGTENKFNTAYKDMPRKGNIGLQYHGHPIWFRNIKVKEL
jgi:sugar phosphate isomerase/epimerase